MTNSANISLGYLESKVRNNSLKFIHFTASAENTELIHWLGSTTVWITPPTSDLPASGFGRLLQVSGNAGAQTTEINPCNTATKEHCPSSHFSLHWSLLYTSTNSTPV